MKKRDFTLARYQLTGIQLINRYSSYTPPVLLFFQPPSHHNSLKIVKTKNNECKKLDHSQLNFPSKVKRLTIDTFVLVRKPEEKVTCSRKEKPKNLFFSYEITFHKMKNGERKNKLFSWFLCVCILFLALLQARGKKEKKKGH